MNDHDQPTEDSYSWAPFGRDGRDMKALSALAETTLPARGVNLGCISLVPRYGRAAIRVARTISHGGSSRRRVYRTVENM